MSVVEACERFAGVGAATAVDAVGTGHIHQTWIVATATGRWVVQACNEAVFADMAAVSANLELLATVLPGLVLARTPEGASLWRDGAGRAWRARRHLGGRVLAPGELTPSPVAALGAGLARFHRDTLGIDPARLAVTIAGFHDPARRLVALDGLDVPDDERRRVDRFGWLAAEAARMQAPAVPARVAHFDAKVDNFLVDDEGAVVAVIDLDTVMPGSVLWDVGDLARSASATSAEDEPDGMAFDGARFDALIRGYRGTADPFITDSEVAGLRLAPLVVTFEQAVRFLADHAAGDLYYRVAYPGHNLVRARAQLTLLESMAAALA